MIVVSVHCLMFQRSDEGQRFHLWQLKFSQRYEMETVHFALKDS